GVLCHQSIQFLPSGVMNSTSTFRGEDLLPQSFPQRAHGFQDVPGPDRWAPLLLEIRRFTRGQQAGSLKPAQERREVRKQLHRFAVLDWPCVHEVQSQLVADEEKPVFPVRSANCPGLVHSAISTMVTPIKNLF